MEGTREGIDSQEKKYDSFALRNRRQRLKKRIRFHSAEKLTMGYPESLDDNGNSILRFTGLDPAFYSQDRKDTIDDDDDVSTTTRRRSGGGREGRRPFASAPKEKRFHRATSAQYYDDPFVGYARF